METVKVTQPDTEPGFEFSRAWIGGSDLHLEPHAIVGGVDCLIETKPTMAAWGIAYCAPLDGDPFWPLYVIVEITRLDGSVYSENWENCTDRPQVVAAARRFLELQASGEARLGMTL